MAILIYLFLTSKAAVIWEGGHFSLVLPAHPTAESVENVLPAEFMVRFLNNLAVP